MHNYLKRIFHWKLIIISLTVILALTIILSAALGPANIPPSVILKILASKISLLNNPANSLGIEETIVFEIRLPRIILAMLVGAALSVAGVTFQGLFKNPMADPYVIGVSSGAALGATLAVVLGLELEFFGLSSIPLMAFIGALTATFMVYNIAKVGHTLPVSTLLLSGIAVGSFLSAITMLIMMMAGERLHQIVFWLMGGLSARNWSHVKMVLPFIFLGTAIIYFFARDLNIMLLGEESAQHLGIEVKKLTKIMLVFASLIAAAAVSVSGLIGFIGLVVPHIMRILVGPDHRILLPSSAIAGSIILITSDTVARTAISSTEIPVGIITAFFGAPFFIYLLRKRKSSIS